MDRNRNKVALKTETDGKANLREWRDIFELRCAKAANPPLMLPLLKELSEKIPVVFDDLAVEFFKGVRNVF